MRLLVQARRSAARAVTELRREPELDFLFDARQHRNFDCFDLAQFIDDLFDESFGR